MAIDIERREFIVTLGGAAAWRAAARAQLASMPVIGFLNPGSPLEWAHLVTAFKEGLAEAGISKAGTSLSITAGAGNDMTGYQKWPPTSFAARCR